MLSAPDRLALGLWALDYVETASITADWRRFGKFGRGAFYVILHECQISPAALAADQSRLKHSYTETLMLKSGELWHSDLAVREPQRFVGDATSDAPIFEQVWAAGAKAHALAAKEPFKRKASFDADEALDELIGGSRDDH